MVEAPNHIWELEKKYYYVRNRKNKFKLKVIECLNGISWNRNITIKSKFNIYETLIKRTFFYGSETLRLVRYEFIDQNRNLILERKTIVKIRETVEK